MTHLQRALDLWPRADALLAQGETVSAVARALGTTRQAVAEAARLNGFDLPQSSIRSASSERRDAVLAWVRANPGHALPDIALACGVRPNTVASYLRGTPERALVLNIKRRSERRFTDDDIIRALTGVYRELLACDPPLRNPRLSRVAYTERAQGRGLPSVPLVVKRFGSWDNACRIASVPAGQACRTNYTRRWSDDDMWAALRRYVDDPEAGARTYDGYCAYAREHDLPSGPSVLNRLGRWSAIRSRLVAPSSRP